MRRLITTLTVLGLTLTAAPSMAQELEAPALDAMDRKVALMFDLDGLLMAPSNFEQIGIGLRYALSDALHLRGAVGLDSRSTEVDPENGDNQTDESNVFALEGGVDFVLRRNENLVLYVGGLLQVGTFMNDPDGEDNKEETTSFTLAAVAGANWFFTRNVSLGAEYRFGVERSVLEKDRADSETTTDVRIGTGSAAFLLGFWF